jgi:hypothetical protein
VSSSLPGARGVEGIDLVSGRNALIRFRGELYECFERRADALFELTDAVLTGPEREDFPELIAPLFRDDHWCHNG